MDRDGLRELIRGGDSVVARWNERVHGEDIAARLQPSERRGGSGRAGLGVQQVLGVRGSGGEARLRLCQQAQRMR